MNLPLRSTVALFALAATPLILALRGSELPPPPPGASADTTAWSNIPLSGPQGESAQRSITSLSMAETCGLAVATQRHAWRSIDGGGSWEPLRLPQGAGQAVALQADGTGIVAGPRMYRTTDCAKSFAEASGGAGRPMGDVVFADLRRAIAIGQSTVLRSSDAGGTWTAVDVPDLNFYAVAFGSPLLGVVVGGAGAMLRTSDGGTTWSHSWLPYRVLLRGVAFSRPDVATIVGSGGTILRSADAGVTWQLVESGTRQHLRSVAFSDARNGVVVGMSGTVLRTSDAGQTWRADASGTPQHLLDVAFGGAGDLFTAGWGPILLRRTTGAVARFKP